MSDHTTWNGKALSLMIVSLVALGGALALAGAMSPPARAATCDQGGPTILGDWTVTTVEVCSGIPYTIDGNLTINAGGSLTLVNGGLTFAKDYAHSWYHVTVNAGGSLILDDAYVTVELTLIHPDLKLPFTVSGGTFTMVNGSYLKFPGWFNATGATISMSGSAITGFLPGELVNTGVYIVDNDNSPIISWASTTATLYASQIARIYENTSAAGATNVTGPIEGNVTLTSGSNLYAYDSYIAADFSNVFGLHNEIRVDGTSNAYLFNVTIDQSETPVQESVWKPAYVPSATTATGGSIYLFRWAKVSVEDATAFPVSGAAIVADSSPQNTPAVYPDNGGSTTPSARTLTYLGKSASGANGYATTDANGLATIPLFTDLINVWSLPNANSSGSYALTATYSTSTASGGVGFHPYPAVTWQDNNVPVTIQFGSLHVRTGPYLVVTQSGLLGSGRVYVNQPFQLYAVIENQGQTDATGATVHGYLDGSQSNQVATLTGVNVAASTSTNRTLNVTAIATTGTHTIEVVVDTSSYNVTVNVLPPPNGFVAIKDPVDKVVVAPGDQLSVDGYVRTPSSVGIPSVALTITLTSGSTTIATNTTTTDGSGFFFVTLTVPAGTANGAYQLSVSSPATTIGADTRSITVQTPTSFLNAPVPLLGIAWWLFLIIIAIIVAVVIVVTLYFKVYGLGKMVECGECGAFIPEDATVCPKCGVEFEKDMAKCSNCQAWIPVDVKQCPECGVEFATGELDMADYQQKMRLQYDEVVQKFKEDASRQLGRSLSEQEFQEWWRRQPTFLTFEDWLHEEEEMRKQGSKGCPVCGTLNSVTAKVCHKCGSLMAAPVTKPSGTVKVGAPKRVAKPVSAPAQAPAPAEEPPEPTGPVVQKRVIKRTPAEGETEDQGQNDQNL